MTFRLRVVALLAALIAGAALSGCSSPSPADRRIQSERSAVLPVAKRIYEQLYGAHVVWGYSITGSPSLCGIGDALARSTSNLAEIQYSTEQVTVPYAATSIGDFAYQSNVLQFAPKVVQKLEADGWKLRLLSTGPSANPAYVYGVRADGLDIEVDISQLAGQTPAANLDISGPCFNGGASARNLTDNPKSETDTVTVPRPAGDGG